MTLLTDLRQALGRENVLEEPLELHIYSKDASLMRGEASVVVFPQSAEDVATVLASYAREALAKVERAQLPFLASVLRYREG